MKTPEEIARLSAAAHKAWATRRKANPNIGRESALKAWVTIRKNNASRQGTVVAADELPPMPDAGVAVAATRPPSWAPSAVAAHAPWLDKLPEGGVRQVFEHLAAHGTVTESEAASMLGGARGLRRFALQFELLAQEAPWGVRIDVVAGVKRYVREGSNE